MEIISTNRNYKITFEGTGSELFGIVIVNWLLTALTLGFYYPWAKAKQLSYLYGATALNSDRFAFHGTGKEMFMGFIKAIVLLGIVYGIFYGLFFAQLEIVAGLFIFIAMTFISPIAIHGSYRYRMSRTSWRGIRFGYRGNRNEFIGLFLKWTVFTICLSA